MQRRGSQVFAAAVLIVACVSGAQARGNHHRDSGYGVQGGVSPELFEQNVFNGIYGPGYAEARNRYNFGSCRTRGFLYDEDAEVGSGCR